VCFSLPARERSIGGASHPVMLRLLWQMSRGYRLWPWRSPYLRWRIETYSGLHAETISFRQFWQFTWKTRHELLRYLRWAERARNNRRMAQSSRIT
jgi:hypothetical protein